MTIDCWPFGCHVCGDAPYASLDMPCPTCEERTPSICRNPDCRTALMAGRAFPPRTIFHPDYAKDKPSIDAH